ncbi:glycosyltransferase family 2 protein [Nocardioides piscis]|uniref:Glycosyltransferase n=1 Tax=Nocardioides piscis TaxID=2714938 RepID=A0A6G7YK19_9ACTN|nr:glycosyltransferase [Nocardioides piscis]QIK77078.1 glycosyltransferase [Nocardioides piscis]
MPTEQPRITFAIPYYRGRDYLREAVQSVRRQTVCDWLLLVVDDRGPEPADEVIAEFDDPRITLVRNERNLGLAGNWNECVRLATTPYVTILHGDDRLLPEYAERVLAAAEREPGVTALFTDAVNIDGHGAPTRTMADVVKGLLPRRKEDHLLVGDDDLAALLAGNYIVCPTMCLRRDVVGPAPFDATLRFVPDWEFTTRALMEGGGCSPSARRCWSIAATAAARRHCRPRTRPGSLRRSRSSGHGRPNSDRWAGRPQPGRRGAGSL